MLRGVRDLAALPAIARSADGLPGVRWVDQVQSVSALLGRYRHMMGLLLVAGHAAVLLALAWRYGRRAWRAWLPTAVATRRHAGAAGAVSASRCSCSTCWRWRCCWASASTTASSCSNARTPTPAAAWLSVVLGAASTWLSFGLLALSSTPALRSFGLTLLFGILIVVARRRPLYRPRTTRHLPENYHDSQKPPTS